MIGVEEVQLQKCDITWKFSCWEYTDILYVWLMCYGCGPTRAWTTSGILLLVNVAAYVTTSDKNSIFPLFPSSGRNQRKKNRKILNFVNFPYFIQAGWPNSESWHKSNFVVLVVFGFYLRMEIMGKVLFPSRGVTNGRCKVAEYCGSGRESTRLHLTWLEIVYLDSVL